MYYMVFVCKFKTIAQTLRKLELPQTFFKKFEILLGCSRSNCWFFHIFLWKNRQVQKWSSHAPSINCNFMKIDARSEVLYWVVREVSPRKIWKNRQLLLGQLTIKPQIGRQFSWNCNWLKGRDCFTAVPNFNSIS